MLSIEDLHKTFAPSRREKSGAITAVGGVSIDVQPGEMFTLLGPSGCGKTTTLRCVGGLDYADSGVIRIGGKTVYSSHEGIRLPANRRNLGMVFQSYAIWPHLDVFKNVSFPLEVGPRRKRLPKNEVRRRVEHALGRVQLDHLAGRPATDLSGGQQQRLALARALVKETPLLLLDEPLSNLDAQLREEMRLELKRLQRGLGITAIYVTHDQTEALSMSSRIAVMNAGHIEQVAKPREVYEHPASRFVAGFVGTTNFIQGVVSAEVAKGEYSISTTEGTLRVSSAAHFPVGRQVVLSIRPEHVQLVPLETPAANRNCWEGEVMARAFVGEFMEHLVQVGKLEVKVRSSTSVSIPPGSGVTLTLPIEECRIVPAEE